MKIDEYKKVQIYKDIGLSKTKVAEKLDIPLCAMRKVWEITEDEFCRLTTRLRLSYEKYREFTTGKSAREMFTDEAKSLVKVPYVLNQNKCFSA